jgi:pimeloyl-ACP methyl ester carboxylesterase
MATFVLVHGGNISIETWNRLTVGKPVHTEDGMLGGKCWDVSVTALKAHGYRTFAPTLSDEHTSSLSDHIGQICDLLQGSALEDVVLVGHSYGGMVITGVAAMMPDRIRHMVYLDAALPDPGESLFDLIASGGIDPLSVPGLEPVTPYVEKLQFDPLKIRSIPKTYIRCIKSDFVPVTSVARRKIEAAKEGWTYLELPASHVPMADMPDEFNRILLDIARK